MNPYWNKHIFEFFGLFFQRLYLFMSGQLPLSSLATDEIQIGVLALISIAAAFVGSLLLLRRMTMLANALSHTILLGIIGAFLLVKSFSSVQELSLATLDLKILLIAALVTAFLTCVCTEWLTKVMRLYNDASIGLVFSVFFALGVTLVTLLTRNTHLGIEAIMGNVDALHYHDLKLMFWICLFDVFAVLIFFKIWHLTTFDAVLAKTLGFSPTLMGYVLMALTALTAIGAFRAVGAFLVLGLMIFPSLIARLFCQTLKTMILLASGIGCVVSVLAVSLSRHMLSCFGMPLSTSGLLIVLLTLCYLGGLTLARLLQVRIRKTQELLSPTP